MTRHEGGCLCGAVRYAVSADPLRVTICHCRFCQRATGGAYMVEPIFEAGAHRLLGGTPRRYDQISAGSGKMVHVHFCERCGTKLWLGFERFEGVVGVYAGTFDDPDWFAVTPDNARHIFTSEARSGTVLPAGFPVFARHATTNDGTPETPEILSEPRVIG